MKTLVVALITPVALTAAADDLGVLKAGGRTLRCRYKDGPSASEDHRLLGYEHEG
jgi:hypothetical protein